MPYNHEEINVERLFRLLESISTFIGTKINIYALGGTALTILSIKKSTLDIDINIDTKKEYLYLQKIFEEVGFEKRGIYRWITQEGLAFDIFHGSNILGTELLSDCLEKSTFIKSFGNIDLYTLSLEDIIISKLARGDSRDFEDIKSILDHKAIDLKGLISRYKETMKISTVAHHKQKLLDLIEIKFKEWKLKIDPNTINEVRAWD